jgi:predicted amidohydrolase YtcJ
MRDLSCCVGPFGFLLVVLAVVVSGCAPKVEPADLVLNNGKVVTVDPAKPEAQAVAVRGDVIVAVGSNDEIKPYINEKTEVIDLGGKLAVPAFIDSHVHFTGIGQNKLQLDLMKVKNWDEVIAMVAEAVKKAKPGEVISGRG